MYPCSHFPVNYSMTVSIRYSVHPQPPPECSHLPRLKCHPHPNNGDSALW